MSGFRNFLEIVGQGKHLSADESSRAFQMIMAGGVTPPQLAAFLMGLKINGETIDEVSGAVIALRNKMKKLPVSDELRDEIIDTCGTGGDGMNTYNISTTVAFVLAGCGVKVAKHGNRAVSSKSGSSDVLTSIGVNIKASQNLVLQSLDQAGVCFLMAPLYHPAMRHVADTRRELGIRTMFNLLGPMVNPARPRKQIIGVYSKELVEPVANVLKNIGMESAWVVHGEDGMDEISIMAQTYIAQLKDGEITTFTITPEEYGFKRLEDASRLTGGDSDINAQALKNVLGGASGAYRDVVIMNSAAGLVVAGKADDYAKAIKMAEKSIDSGAAKNALHKMVEITNLEINENS